MLRRACLVLPALTLLAAACSREPSQEEVLEALAERLEEERAEAGAVQLTAHGQAPAWQAVIADGQIELQARDGEIEQNYALNRVEPGRDGTRYWGEGPDGTFLMTTREETCSTAQSGETFELTVSVLTDTLTLRGCGSLQTRTPATP